MIWLQELIRKQDITSDVQHTSLPRCRRPARDRSTLKTLRVDGDSFSFTPAVRLLHTATVPNPRVIFASDRRADGRDAVFAALPGRDNADNNGRTAG